MLKSRFLHLVTILLISFQFLSCSGSGGNSTNPSGNNNSGGGSNGNNGGNTGANICGDGNIAGTEDCDDGNTASNDGCSSTCTDECRLYVKANAAPYGNGLSWTNAFGSISDALRTRDMGGSANINENCKERIIFIAKGIYYESLYLYNTTKLYGGFSGGEHTIADRTLPFFNGNYDDNSNTLDGLTVNSNNFTILDGGNNNTIIRSTKNFLVDSVVLQNGQARTDLHVDSLGESKSGGAILIDASQSTSNLNMTLVNSLLRNNNAQNGGAIFAHAKDISRNVAFDINFNACGFHNNQADAGGAIFINTSSFYGNLHTTINDSTFTHNTAANFGGAIYNSNERNDENSTTSLIFNRSNLSANSAGSNGSEAYGGAIYNYNWNALGDNSITINYSILNGNNAVTNGGAISHWGHVNSNTPTIIVNNSILDLNRAEISGGAVNNVCAPSALGNYCGWNTPAVVIFNNSTVANNTTSASLGAYSGAAYNGFKLMSTNSIFWNNNGSAGLNNTSSIAFNISYTGLQDFGTYYSNNHNVNLTTSPFQLGSYELNPINGAACIDSGNNLSTYLQNICLDETTDTCVDLAGNNRIVNFKNLPQATVDMGAFEAQSQ